MVLSESVNSSAQPGLENCDGPPASSTIASAPVEQREEELLGSLYQDEEVDRALRNIVEALPHCHPDHQDEIEELHRRCYEAVEVVRKFRAEVSAKTKKVLQEHGDARGIFKGSTVLLEPGEGPEALLETLGRVLEYTEVKSREQVERERRLTAAVEKFHHMEEYNEGEVRGHRKSAAHEGVRGEADERLRQITTVGTTSLPTTQQAKGPQGKLLSSARLEKHLTKAVRRHMEGVVQAAEVKLEVAYQLCGPREFQKIGAVAVVALWLLNFFESVYESLEDVNERVGLGDDTMRSFDNRLRTKPRRTRELTEATQQMEKIINVAVAKAMESVKVEMRKQAEEIKSQIAEGSTTAEQQREAIREDVQAVRADVKGVGVEVKGIGRGVKGVGAKVEEVGAKVEEVGTNVKDMLQRVKKLEVEIDDVLKALNGVQIDRAGGKCPRGFFLVPADKTAWSWVKHVDCFSLYTTNVELFFVCRLFFEELKIKTEMERNALTRRSKIQQFEHELSDSIPLQLPKEEVVKRLHAIRLSAKILKVLVTASTLGLSVGNLVPALSFAEEDELLGAVQSHLAEVEEHALSGEAAKDLNLLQSTTRSNFLQLGTRRLKQFLHFRKKQKTICLAEASGALQGYLDEKHCGVWQDKVHSKLKITPNLDRTNYAYICKETGDHEEEWKGRTLSGVSYCGAKDIER